MLLREDAHSSRQALIFNSKGVIIMTRMYLSPTATFFAKIGLFFIECLIELYSLITYPFRKLTLKKYSCIVFISCAFYVISCYLGLKLNVVNLIVSVIAFTIITITSKLFYNYLKKKVCPRIAYLINSPMGIPLNKFYS